MKAKRLFLVFAIGLVGLLFIGCNGDTTDITTDANTTANTETTNEVTTNEITTSENTTEEISTEVGTFTVTFVTYDGTPVTAQTVEDGSLVSAVTSTLEDYAVSGWYTDANFTVEWNFATDTVTENLTLYAKWEFTYQLLGEGTEASPYLVASEKDLEVIRDGRLATTANEYFRQTADLVIESSFSAIDGVVFNGHYDGNGFQITLTGDSGIFYRNDGEIGNLTIDANIETESVNSIGALTHFNNGQIENITVVGEGVRSLVGVVGTYEEGVGGAGAIAGTNLTDGVISTCETNTNVQARVGGGGIVGDNQGLVTLCSVWGTVGEKEVIYISEAEKAEGKFSYAGGIAGINSGIVSQSENRGRVFAQRAGNSIDDVSNNNKVFGGIVGYNLSTGLVTECYNAYGTAGATVHADRIVGGIVGLNYGGVTYSYSPANIGARANLGGIVGLQDESETSVAFVAYSYSNSNFRSDGNETDEIAAYLSTDVTNWYSVAKYADYCYYSSTRGMAPTGEGNVSGVSVTLDMTEVLNTGLAVGEEKFIATDGASSGNAKTKLVWQKNTMAFVVEENEYEVTVQMGNTPAFDGTPEKTGYAFIEWRTDLADPATVWNPGGITENMKVYAYFEIIDFTITYVLDGGTNDVANPETYTYETPTITLLDAARDGCIFLGWFNEDEEQVTTIDLNSLGNITLTAGWQINVDYVTIHFVDETMTDVTVLDLVGAEATLPEMTLEGYRFLGWSLDGATVAYPALQVLTYTELNALAVEGVVTLTPLYEQIFNYTIAYDANGANGTMDSVVVETGIDVVLVANAFSADGYTFMGWLYNGTLYEDGDTVKDLALAGETATMVAMWVSTANLVVNGDFPTDGEFTSADTKTFTLDNWNVYRNGTTNVPSLAVSIADSEMVVSATIATGATSLNFYTYTAVSLPNIQVGSYYYVSFDAKIDLSGYEIIGVYLRAKTSPTSSYSTVANLVTFNTLGTDMTTFSTILNAYQNIAEGNTYYLIITLAIPGGGVAGTYVWTIDNIGLFELGAVAQ